MFRLRRASIGCCSKRSQAFSDFSVQVTSSTPVDCPGGQPKYVPKITPKRDEIPADYLPLLDWYESWSEGTPKTAAAINWEDDPLIRLIGSGKHIWADEHADEYVENLRREDI